MATSPERRPRRGPAPIASFDHDVSEESSPETKQAIRLPEIREDPTTSTTSVAGACSSDGLAPPEQRARSHSSPAVHAHSTSPAPATDNLQTPSAPRIDISRASSSSHQDSRDSSPELALFAGTEDSKARLELGFREDGALDLRSSTEELAFLEGAPGGADPPRAPSVAPSSRRHSRKDSQGSEAALLAVSGRTSRLSSVGSQCSAHSALSGFSHTSRVSRLSVVSGISRSPSPHKMLLETSFCGPKPIETDPDICAAAVEQRLLEIAKMSTETMTTSTISQPSFTFATPVDARDRREVRTEVTVENARPASAARFASPSPQPTTTTATPRTPITTVAVTTASMKSPAIAPFDDDKFLKETRNRAKVEERRTRPKVRRQPSQSEVFKSSNRSKDVIRIKLKPDEEYDDDDEESERTLIGEEAARKPVTLELKEKPARPIETISPQTTPRRPRDSRTPSPTGVSVSRKSSFCSLFKSRETIASPDSPSDVLRRKKSLNEGRSRSKSRDRSTTPTSAAKIKGSMLSLFKTPRKSTASPSPSSRDVSPVVQQQRQFPQTPADRTRSEKLKYYEDSKDGIIHIPLRTPPDELNKKDNKEDRSASREIVRPASAPQPRGPYERSSDIAASKPAQRTVLPDGSIIIPLHSPTEKIAAKPDLPRSLPKTSTPSTSRRDSGQHKVDETSPEANLSRTTEGPVQAVRQEIQESTTNVPDRQKRKERIIFTTHIGSREQVFSTQFSITKTPSVTSEISESAPSFLECEEVRPSEPMHSEPEAEDVVSERIRFPVKRSEGRDEDEDGDGDERAQSPGEVGESSGSDASSRSGGSEPERRGLVVQESFEELPYVPTTLPLERSLALPMVPVRERGGGGVPPAAVQRPRARGVPLGALAPATSPGTPPALPPAPPARLRIRLPQRTRASSASGPAPARSTRPRSRSGGDGVEVRKSEWIDFSELPEQRKQPKRIETVPASLTPAGTGVAPVQFSYVPPEHCSCECHTNARDDERPLLHADERLSSSSLECEEAGPHGGPFTADLDLRNNHTDIARPQ